MPRLDQEPRERLSSGQRVLAEDELAALERTDSRKGATLIIWVLGIAVVVIAAFSFCLGRYAVSIEQVGAALANAIVQLPSILGGARPDLSAADSVVVNVRLPRILAALLVGAALAIAGASYQGVFRNPMVSSDILGASAGAGFGASMAILAGASGVVVQIAAFGCGLLAVGITYSIGNAVGKGDSSTLSLVLAGIVVQALFQAFIGCAKYLADPYSQLPEITYWLMGSLANVSLEDIGLILLPLIVGTVVLLALRWRVNVLSFGDEEAASLGVDTRKLRFVIIVCATLVTGSAVSVAGQVGWIGLVVPHLARMIVGPNYRHLMPASLVIGAGFLLIVDDVARNIMSAEIPLGILTALIGAPVFVFLLLKGKRGWV